MSDAAIKSCDNGQVLQKTVPSIIHVSSDEKCICTPPTVKLSIERDAVRKTIPIVRLRRFVFELKNFSRYVRTAPIIAPRRREHTISIKGFTIMERISISPLTIVFAIPNDTANTTRPTASSSATIGSNNFVRGPFALYCLTTIKVAAGAVAVAIAPSVRTCGNESISGRIKWKTYNAISTKSVATSA